VKHASDEAHYVVVSGLLLRHPSSVQIFSSATRSQIHSVWDPVSHSYKTTLIVSFIWILVTAFYFNITTIHSIYSHVHFVIFSCINKQSHIILNAIRYISSPTWIYLSYMHLYEYTNMFSFTIFGYKTDSFNIFFFPVEKFRCILNLRNVFLKPVFKKLDASWVQGCLLFEVIWYLNSSLALRLFWSLVLDIQGLYVIIHQYCHVLMTRHGIWIDNWIHWLLITRNFKWL
jgi:hypothetical protein